MKGTSVVLHSRRSARGHPSTFFGGLEVHQETLAVASGGQEREAEMEVLGHVWPPARCYRQAQILGKN
jgi:hypothetical protein